jgi:hypothetical protein
MTLYFKQELFFKQLTGLCFLYPGTKGTKLSSKCDKTHIHNNPEYEATAHFMQVRQLLTASCSIIFTTVFFFSIRKRTGFAGSV